MRPAWGASLGQRSTSTRANRPFPNRFGRSRKISSFPSLNATGRAFRFPDPGAGSTKQRCRWWWGWTVCPTRSRSGTGARFRRVPDCGGGGDRHARIARLPQAVPATIPRHPRERADRNRARVARLAARLRSGHRLRRDGRSPLRSLVPLHVHLPPLPHHPEDHALAGRKSVELAEAAEYPAVAPPVGTQVRRVSDAVIRLHRLAVEVVMEVDGWSAIKRYVEAGSGSRSSPASV